MGAKKQQPAAKKGESKTDTTKNLKPFGPGPDPRRQVGRKRGSLNVKTVLKRYLEATVMGIDPTLQGPDGRPVVDPETNKPYLVQMTVMDQVALALISKARNGDVYAINTLYDRLEGKPNQKVALTGEDDGPIQITQGGIDYSALSTGTLTELYHAQKQAEEEQRNKVTGRKN